MVFIHLQLITRQLQCLLVIYNYLKGDLQPITINYKAIYNDFQPFTIN